MPIRAKMGSVFPTYLKTIHAQLSHFQSCDKVYHLPSNPAQKAGSMGSEEHKEMLFWTKEEYLKFADVMMDKPLSLMPLKCFTGAVSVWENCLP